MNGWMDGWIYLLYLSFYSLNIIYSNTIVVKQHFCISSCILQYKMTPKKLMLSTSHRQPEVIICSQSIINLNMSIKENCPLITHALVRKPVPRQSERTLNIPQTLWACQIDGIIISKVEGRAISSRVYSSPRHTHPASGCEKFHFRNEGPAFKEIALWSGGTLWFCSCIRAPI